MTVGRADGNDLQLDDPLVSAIHLELVPGPEGIVVRDLGSTNGTWIGPHRVRDVVLAGDALVRVGSTVLELSPLSSLVPVEVSGEKRAFGRLVGESVAIWQTFATLERLAASDLTVLLEGETGTGKEEFARAVHERSARGRQPFVVLDCAAIPEGVAEAMILGHERGAFTGADQQRTGAFRAADGGTIFLDEIGELPLGLQPKLLRVLETHTVTPVGATHSRSVDVRVIAATHRDLRTAVNMGAFRADLYYRLAEAHVPVPPPAASRWTTSSRCCRPTSRSSTTCSICTTTSPCRTVSASRGRSSRRPGKEPRSRRSSGQPWRRCPDAAACTARWAPRAARKRSWPPPGRCRPARRQPGARSSWRRRPCARWTRCAPPWAEPQTS